MIKLFYYFLPFIALFLPSLWVNYILKKYNKILHDMHFTGRELGKKILEGLILAGVLIGFGVIFLIEALDLFVVRPIYQRLFKKKRPKKSRRNPA